MSCLGVSKSQLPTMTVQGLADDQAEESVEQAILDNVSQKKMTAAILSFIEMCTLDIYSQLAPSAVKGERNENTFLISDPYHQGTQVFTRDVSWVTIVVLLSSSPTARLMWYGSFLERNTKFRHHTSKEQTIFEIKSAV